MLDLTTAITDQSPPLCGHLQLVGDDTVAGWPGSVDLAHELPNGFNFRSVELETFSLMDPVQPILQSYAHTLKNLIIVIHDRNAHSTCRPSLPLSALTVSLADHPLQNATSCWNSDWQSSRFFVG